MEQIIAETAVAAAGAANDTETEFADQQTAVAAAAVAVQDVLGTSASEELVADVNAVLIPPPQKDQEIVNVEQLDDGEEEIIPEPEQTPEVTTTTTL
ncbi:MAG: hypothetical protein J6386_20035 [Candidatus Synoicihabitans palmerolidicus]|nr:hypothetical protein [Candidatus Synoicihabitans palmerolidicus]